MGKRVLKYQGMDSFARPVYKCKKKLFVDVDPRKGVKPNICTKYRNEFDAEPDTPIMYISEYKDLELEFEPERITW